ncbi:MAG: SBBP repeat-containing protein [Planctomycetales bacterium]|nr:SBBP repeat-containing protein [Planctomycetales bacterium]
MIRTMTLLLMAVTASDVCHGQTLEWARQLGTSEVDSGVDISVDNHGSVYIVGNTEGAFAGAGIGDSDGYIGKYSELGTLEWIRQIGTTAFDNARSVSADGLGSVYVSGHTRGGFSGENAGSYDGFLAKYNEDGESVWTLQIGTSEIDEAWGVSADGMGNVYVAGHTAGDLAGVNLGMGDAFLAKYNDAGQLLWTQQFGTSAYDMCIDVAADQSGNVYVVGNTEGDLDGVALGAYDTFVGLFDSNGNLKWIRQHGTNAYDEGQAIATDGLGNAYIVGDTYGDLVAPQPEGGTLFLSKFDHEGMLDWSRQFGTVDIALAGDVAADQFGNVFVTGFTEASFIDDGAYIYGAFLSSFDSGGALLWNEELFTENGATSGSGVSTDDNRNVYISGTTQRSLAGPSAGSHDAFLAKYHSDVPEPSGLCLTLMACAAHSCLGHRRRI